MLLRDDQPLVALSVTTPNGPYSLYALRFADGEQGLAVIETNRNGVSALQYGPDADCHGPWALTAPLAFASAPGRLDGYVAGRLAAVVHSVSATGLRGTTASVVVAGKYFLGWVAPKDGQPGSAQIVARDAHGRPLGNFTFIGDGTAPQSNRGAWCG